MKMMNSNNFDEMLGTLRSTEPYLADDGFTSGVMARLPEARQLPSWLTNLIMLGFTAIGSAIAAWQLPMTAWQLPVMKLVSFTTSSLLSLSVLGIAAISTFVISYIVIWLAQNDSI
jgi:hypothetical protein